MNPLFHSLHLERRPDGKFDISIVVNTGQQADHLLDSLERVLKDGTVEKPDHPTLGRLTHDYHKAIKIEADKGNKIGAVKLVRELSGMGLYEAKQYVEYYFNI